MELLSEPMYILAQNLFLFRVRTLVEGSSVFLRCLATYHLVANYEVRNVNVNDSIYILVFFYVFLVAGFTWIWICTGFLWAVSNNRILWILFFRQNSHHIVDFPTVSFIQRVCNYYLYSFLGVMLTNYV